MTTSSIHEIKIDDEFKTLLPPLTPDEYATLENNLKTNGCLNKLIVWGDTLLDGHNRLEICTRLGIPYEVKKIHLESRIDAFKWIVANQDGQRNLDLNSFARSEVALKCTRLIADLRQNSDAPIGRTDDKIGEIAKVSRDTIRKVQAVLERAPSEIIEQARAHKISTHRAWELTKALDTASETVKAITIQHRLTEPETVSILANLHPSSETLKDVATNGYIDSADGLQVHITASPLAVKEAIQRRSQAHKQIAMDTKPNLLTLYNTSDLQAVAVALERHYGERITALIDVLTARQVMAVRDE